MKKHMPVARALQLGFGLLLGLLTGQAGAAESERPNIVLLLADDWGFTDVGAYGGEMATPNLDLLAARGMRFSNFHVTASCAPTRSMLMTGVDNHRNGVGNMPETIPQSHIGKPGYLGVLDTNVVTVASLLRDSGYHTYISGKWHLGHEPWNLPPARGFERSVIQADSGSDNWEMKQYLSLKPDVYWYEEGRRMHSLPDDFYSSTYFVSRAIEQIESNQNSGQPFFSYIAFQANHIPLQAPQSFIDKYRGRYDQGWTVLRQQRQAKAIELGLIPPGSPMVTMDTTQDWDALSAEDKAYQARRMEVYAAMAEAMDHEVGRLITYLKETGQYDNTVFLFLSDNGAEGSDPYATFTGRLWLDRHYVRTIERLGSKGAYSIIGPSWASAAASPLNTYKFWAGEGGIRVPLIVSGIPGVAANSVSPAFSHVTDIAPTLLALAGVAQPEGVYQGKPVERMIGRSLLPVLRSQAGRVYPADQPVGYELSGNAAVFKGDYKLLRNLPPIGDGQWHLYDLGSDPGETDDLREQLPELFAQLQADYAQYASDNNVLPMPEGYDPIEQVFINSLVNVYLPQLTRWGIPVLLLMATGIYLLRRRRKQRK
jgi:arylsulfatase/uncharacterized sulfatase